MSQFDRINDRYRTGSSKWDKYGDSDILPMWVADMDFQAPPAVIEAIGERASHGVFGYNVPPPGLVEVVIDRFDAFYHMSVAPDELVFGPGVVPALNQAVRAFVGPGEAVITAVPIYHPFLSAPEHFDRKLYRARSFVENGRWRYPIEKMRSLMKAHPEIRLLLLSNPYNPVGRLLEPGELSAIVELCAEFDVLICSDEIHCDLLLDGQQHVPTDIAHPEAPLRTVTMMSASKTFNVAGLGGYVAVIRDPELRERFVLAGEGIMANVNTFAYVAMQTAWRDCEDWRQELLAYLASNRDYLAGRIGGMPGIGTTHVEATYLAWLDVQALDLPDPLQFFENAGVGMSPGEQFDGEGFIRLNFACPRSRLEIACDRIEAAIAER